MVAASASAAAAIESAPSGRKRNRRSRPSSSSRRTLISSVSSESASSPTRPPGAERTTRPARSRMAMPPKPSATPPSHAHEVGRADRDDVARSQPLLETAGDARIQAFDVDRPRGEQEGEPPTVASDHDERRQRRRRWRRGGAPPERGARTRQRRPCPLCSRRCIAARALDRVAASMPPIKPRGLRSLKPAFRRVGPSLRPLSPRCGQRATLARSPGIVRTIEALEPAVARVNLTQAAAAASTRHVADENGPNEDEMVKNLDIGDLAPDFDLPTDAGGGVRLKDCAANSSFCSSIPRTIRPAAPPKRIAFNRAARRASTRPAPSSSASRPTASSQSRQVQAQARPRR